MALCFLDWEALEKVNFHITSGCFVAHGFRWVIVAELNFVDKRAAELREVLRVELDNDHLDEGQFACYYSLTLTDRGVTIAGTNLRNVICVGHIDVPKEENKVTVLPTKLMLSICLERQNFVRETRSQMLSDGIDPFSGHRQPSSRP